MGGLELLKSEKLSRRKIVLRLLLLVWKDILFTSERHLRYLVGRKKIYLVVIDRYTMTAEIAMQSAQTA